MQLELLESHPSNAAHVTPILFVHGSWHAAWCWENFLPYFAEHGYHAYALSLRGHGKSEGREKIRWLSATRDYVADVDQVVQALGAPPVLVGHSTGGYVVQKYLEKHHLPAGVLLASVPVSGILGFGVRHSLRHPWAFIKSHLLLDPWHLVATPTLAQDAFFSATLPVEAAARHFARLQTESLRIEAEMLFLALPRPGRVKTPLLVLAAADDRIYSAAEARATARAYRTQAEIFAGMAHDMMLEPGWQKVADRILNWLEARKL
ncbi:MAG: alpha/beta hydrolase [Chloroflexota bacterium]